MVPLLGSWGRLIMPLPFRHYKLEAELAAMSWRIRWEELSGGRSRGKNNPNAANAANAAAAANDRRKPNGAGNAFSWWSLADQQPNANHYGSTTGLTRVDSKTSLAKGSIGSVETIQMSDMNKQQIFTKTASYKVMAFWAGLDGLRGH